MRPADTSEIDELLRAYNRVHPMCYAFYDGATGDFGDHEEALLLEGRVEGLPATPPEAISAQTFYGPLYLWGRETLLFIRRKTTKRPVPIYYFPSGKPLSPEDVAEFMAALEQAGIQYERLADACTGHYEYGDRWGYCFEFFQQVMTDLDVDLSETFKRVGSFITADIKNCAIYDWRADLGPHCTDEDRTGCSGCYLWTVFCPKRKRLTIVYSHLNEVYI